MVISALDLSMGQSNRLAEGPKTGEGLSHLAIRTLQAKVLQRETPLEPIKSKHIVNRHLVCALPLNGSVELTEK